MNHLYTLIALCTITYSFGQQANFEWAKSFGGASNDRGYSITVDASGNVYTTGIFQGTVDFDPGAGTFNLTAVGSNDVFVHKLDASGNLLWAKAFGGVAVEFSQSIAVDAAGNVYSIGDFQDTVDFDPGAGTFNLTAVGNRDVFVQKLDANGNFLWAKSFEGTFGSNYGSSILIDSIGSVYTTGAFSNTVDFDPGAGTFNLTAVGNDDVFVHKLDANGNFLWAKSFGGTSLDIGYSITVDASGNVYTTGEFYNTVDFDPGSGTFNLTAVGNNDVFVHKLDANGNFLWAKSFGGTASDVGSSISVDASGNVYTTGYFEGTVDFDPGPGTNNLTSQGIYEVFIQKLDPSGNFLWAKSFGGYSFDFGRSITVDASGNVYTTGAFSNTVDFDPGPGTNNLSSQGLYDVFIQKIDPSGNFLWAKSFGGTAIDVGSSITVDASGNVYTTGYFRDTVDFDPGAGTNNLSSQGSNDVFIQKMSPCSPTTGTDVLSACGSYTWIDGNTYTASNSTATFTLNNAAGCDSVVTLDLTINTVSDNTVSQTGATLTANNANATYQWIDCDNGNAAISGATTQVYTATANGNYAVVLTENGCIDTSACVNVVLSSTHFLGNERIQVYPNPTTDNINIDFSSPQTNIQLRIYDALGHLVLDRRYTQRDLIQVALPQVSGLYLLELQTDKGSASFRIVKE